MRRSDKKGLSTIVATLLIILLTLVAVGIIWVVVRNMISKDSENIDSRKFSIDLKILSVTKTTDSQTMVQVTRRPGEGRLDGIYFSIYNGVEGFVFNETNVGLNELGTKPFKLDYNGKIVSLSIYPMFITDSGRVTIGNLLDTYYNPEYLESGGGCTPNCPEPGIKCGNDGCGGRCECLEDHHCDESAGICRLNCERVECGERNCGGVLGKPGCGNNFCGECEGNERCVNGRCEECIPDCGDRECGVSPNGCGKCGENNGECDRNSDKPNCNHLTGKCEACTPNCGNRECGVSPNGCGKCGENNGECSNGYNCIDGECIPPETALWSGLIESVFPTPIGRNFITLENVNCKKEEGCPNKGDVEGYEEYLKDANFIKVTSTTRTQCYPIIGLQYPINYEQYIVIQISTGTTDVKEGDYYELWKTSPACVASIT